VIRDIIETRDDIKSFPMLESKPRFSFRIITIVVEFTVAQDGVTNH
jgi:hypothetical protein